MKVSFWIGLGIGAASTVAAISGGKKVKQMAEELKEKAQEKVCDNIHTL